MLTRDIDESNYSDIVSTVDALDAQQNKWIPLNIALLGNITFDTLIPYVKFLCYQDNISANMHVGDYDNVVQEVMNPHSDTYRHTPDMIILCLKLDAISERLVAGFNSLTPNSINDELDHVTSLVNKVLGEIRKNTNAIILVHNFEVPTYPSLGILDYQDAHRQVNTIRKLNSDLLTVVRSYTGAYVLDVDLLQSSVGYANFHDNRLWHAARMPYTREACKALAKEYVKFIRAMKGRNSKCLVVDCDNTLWGGIVGEDGINRISIGVTYPGSAYREFQQAILGLHNRGVMLAICSKNNERDVIEVLEKHPGMILRREHFVSMRINWSDKVTNLKEIAKELNIGLDSLVFVDDNAFEVNLVRQMLPQVKTIELPQDPSSYKDILNSIGLFDTISLSEEDLRRNEMLKAEMERSKARFEAASLEDYLRHLEMEACVRGADGFAVPRVSQLTQRTNQFNLTTKRYTEAEVKSMAEARDTDVLYIQLMDRYGDTGIVGAAILRYAGTEAVVDSFLLSCRVIGRGIEDVLLVACMNRALRRGCKIISGTYLPTEKNGQVADFYESRNFKRRKETRGAGEYYLELKAALPEMPRYFASIRIEE